MAKNKKNKVTDENLPKPESMKKANMKMIGLLCGVIISVLIACNYKIFVGDIRDKILLFAVLVAVIFAIVYWVKSHNNRAK